MDAEAIFRELQKRHPKWTLAVDAAAIDPWIEVAPEGILDACRTLRDEPGLVFDMLHCISGVDYLAAADRKDAGSGPRVEVLYHLSSMIHRHRIVLRVRLPRWKDDVPGELPELASVSGVWRTADWHEREVYDLVGVRFLGHPDPRRILCPDDWQGHPLRKDYEVPDEYHGIRVK
ncbi:MAG: NADH-quinone oxidoreductase subunit C [Pirellulales bacterium]|nr:NADH-quinone oxidoreductase subunit C [Pirellulales bacterium]